MATAKQLDDITKCPICTEVYTDPRELPCVHTYCLKCIREWSKGKRSGDKLVCPLDLCNKEFTLPGNGVGDLPKNVFIATFLHMKELSSAEGKSPCEVCSGDRATGKKVATVLCVECQQKLCRTCQGYHEKFKSTSRHRTVDLGKEINIETLSNMLPFSNCNKHKEDLLRIYCLECKEAICLMCYIENHNSHKCSDIGTMADDFRRRMSGDVGKIAAAIVKCKEMLESLENEKNDLTEQVANVEMEVIDKAEQLKQLIDVYKEKLINDLSLVKRKRTKEIEIVRNEVEKQLLSMESYKKYVDEVRQKGTACDVARAASGLHDRADELLMFNVIEHAMDDIGHAIITFRPTSSDFVTDDNITIGQVCLDIVKQGKPN